MDLGLTGRVAMISGASRGIGKAVAAGLAAEGCRLSLCARGREDLDETVGELRAGGAEVLASTLDVTDSTAARCWFDETRDTYRGIDILVNNVGGSRPGGNLSASADDWRQGFSLNFFSALELCRLVVPAMQERGQGCVINIASIYGREWGGPMTYNAAKAAMISLSKEMARELAPHAIRVNSVAPGSILFPGGSWDRRQKEDPDGIATFVRRELPAGRFGTRGKWPTSWSSWPRTGPTGSREPAST